MKTLPKSFVLKMAWFAMCLVAVNVCPAQVALTVSPSVTSNTYDGFITLNITGLTNTEVVFIQRWLDANSNGVIDAGEPLLESFKIKDGGAMVFSGVTNVSVPYDSNSTTGAITTTINFGPPLALMDITGQQIFQVVSPTGRFAPVTATFTVTNAALPQSVNGILYSNGVAGLPNGMVVALSMPNQNYAGAVITDSGGNYHLNLPVGQYALLGLFPGYYCDQSLAPFVTLTNGASVTNNMSATNGVPVIAGQVYDAANSNALAGVFLQFSQSGGSLFAVAFTDTNGNFSAPVVSNTWKIKLESGALAHRAYVVPEGSAANANTSLGSVSNVNIGLWKANALYYGQVLSSSNTPLANFGLNANDNNNQFKSSGFTDANGNYGVAILGNTNSPWYVSPAGENIGLQNFIYNSPQNFISNTVTALDNFYLLPVTAQISGQLTDNAGHPLQLISMFAFANIGANTYNTTTVDTDTNGNYAFGVANGTWSVFANSSGNHSLANAGYYDPAFNGHSVTIPPTNAVVNIVVYPASNPQFGQASHPFNSQFQFNLYGAAGQNYTVQYSTNLASTSWQTLTIISNMQTGPRLIQDFQATNGTRFYRAFEGP